MGIFSASCSYEKGSYKNKVYRKKVGMVLSSNTQRKVGFFIQRKEVSLSDEHFFKTISYFLMFKNKLLLLPRIYLTFNQLNVLWFLANLSNGLLWFTIFGLRLNVLKYYEDSTSNVLKMFLNIIVRILGVQLLIYIHFNQLEA